MKLALVLLMSAVGCQQARPQTDNTDALVAHAIAGIAHYKKDSETLELILTGDNPSIKECRAKGWPNTEDCRTAALGAVKTLQLYLDNKIPGFARPQFAPGGSK